jgi:flagellar motor protein MotB
MGVKGARLTTRGYGFDQPIASNDNETGRQENRRVEVIILADEDLKKEANQGKIEGVNLN